MNKEVLAVDVDEVLYPFVSAFITHHNEEYGTNLTIEDFNSYDFDGPLGLSVPETVERVYAFQELEDLHIEPLDAAEDAIARLSRQFDLEIVTARHPRFETATRLWTETKFKQQFRGITSIGYAAIMEKPQTKARVCLELGAIALVDDSVKHVIECAESGMEGILFGEYPWNQLDILHPRVTRRPDWPAVAEHFNV